MRVLNLTQHAATPEQIEAGVYDLTGEAKVELVNLLTFDELPALAEVDKRALSIALIARKEGVFAAMVGGAPFLMGPLENALLAERIEPLYAFSRRESIESVQADGSVRKSNVFRHIGFVSVRQD